MREALSKLLTSRRFWTFVITMFANIATMLIAHYVQDPFWTDMAKYLIGAFTTVGSIVIAAYTVDDTASHVAAIKAGVHPYYLPAPQKSEPDREK